MQNKIFRYGLLPAFIMIAPFISMTTSAEIYKWIDEKGHTHMSDRAPENIKTESISLKVSNVSAHGLNNSKILSVDKKPAVILYSASWCGYCKLARSHFKENNVPFKEYDIETSIRGKQDYKRLKGQSVPIILIDDNRIDGFFAAQFDKLWNRSLKN